MTASHSNPEQVAAAIAALNDVSLTLSWWGAAFVAGIFIVLFLLKERDRNTTFALGIIFLLIGSFITSQFDATFIALQDLNGRPTAWVLIMKNLCTYGVAAIAGNLIATAFVLEPKKAKPSRQDV